MKKIVRFISLALLLVPGVVYSKEPVTVSLGGKVETNIGYVSQENPFKYRYKYDDKDNNKLVSQDKIGKYGIANDTKIDIKVSGKSDLGFSYGGRIRLNADTSINTREDDVVADKTMIFVENPYGRIEGGAYDSASNQMKISGASIAFGSGGIDGKFPKWFGKGPRVNSKNEDSGRFYQRYIVYPELPIDCDCVSYTNKVSYFTPSLKGFRFGLSYSPDVAMHGTVYKFHNVSRRTGKDFKDLFDYGFTYEGKLKDISYSAGITGEFAKAKKSMKELSDRTSLNAWEAGFKAKYKEFSIAGSYSDWGKSMTPKNKVVGRKYGSKYWTAGAAYEKGKFGTSLTYFKSYRASTYTIEVPSLTSDHDKSHNKLEYYILSTQYLVADGLLPYIELGKFRAKDSSIAGNKGYVVLTGVKLSF